MNLTDREKEPLKAMIDARQSRPPGFKADEAKRQFHTLFVRQEDWEAHKLTSFGQHVTACG